MRGTVRVCPNCGSTDIGHDSLSVISRLSLSGSMECRECGYTGIFPEVAPEDAEEFEGREEEVQDLKGRAKTEQEFRYSRFGIGTLLFLLGIGASSYASWGNGLLAGLLALAVGAAVALEELSRSFRN
ncbi:MAG: hypothetical protein SVS85_04100 [Candidatus Nanohaloarchaea archaeon]|nr:hypothetical protein [Candidatus Nanohaloarchaea archaeon]